MIKLGWFSSGRDEAARNLLKSVTSDITLNNIPAKIEWVFMNHAPDDSPRHLEVHRARFRSLVKSLGIPLVTLPYTLFFPPSRRSKDVMDECRSIYGQKIVGMLHGQSPVDIVIMAGYMLILGRPELQSFRFINLHPALPWGPTGTWQECIHHIIDNDCNEHGVMTHLATEELDRGPIISYCRFSLQGEKWSHLREKWISGITTSSTKEEQESHKLFLEIRKEGELREIPLLKGLIRKLADGTVVQSSQSVVSGLPTNLDLTELVDTLI